MPNSSIVFKIEFQELDFLFLFYPRWLSRAVPAGMQDGFAVLLLALRTQLYTQAERGKIPVWRGSTIFSPAFRPDHRWR